MRDNNLEKIPKTNKCGECDQPNLDYDTIDRVRDFLDTHFTSVRKTSMNTLVIDGLNNKTVIHISQISCDDPQENYQRR